MGYQRQRRVSETPAAIQVPLRFNGLLAFIFRNVHNVCAPMISYSDLTLHTSSAFIASLHQILKLSSQNQTEIKFTISP